MSVSASCDSVSQKRTLASLLAGRGVKRSRQEDAQRLHEAAIDLMNQQQDLSALLLEATNSHQSGAFCKRKAEQKETELEPGVAGTLLVPGLKRRATELGVPVTALSVRMVLERMTKMTQPDQEEKEGGVTRLLLSSNQRLQLDTLLRSTAELLSLGAFCPRLLWQEYRKAQRQPRLEVVYHLHSHTILTIKCILESDEDVKSWLVPELKAFCGCRALPDQQEATDVQKKVVSTVVGVLVDAGFEEDQRDSASSRRMSQISCSVLDNMLSWFLDCTDDTPNPDSGVTAAELWIQLFDVMSYGACASPGALRRFFTHSLTHTLTYKPRLKVSDAIAVQHEWSFAKTSRLLTSLFRKLAVIFSVEELLQHLQQVLETHEVNWRHVLSFLSTLLVYNPIAQPSLRALLSRLLSSAFEGYDLEHMITVFLLARQGALEGPAFFPSYSEWFRMSFGGATGYHGNSKKSLVFLLKFLSDLAPFDPPQYLKVHILHPPYVAVKHRSLLLEYVSLAKTRLADLKVSLEDMGLYKDVSESSGTLLQPQCPALQDVEKSVSLFEATGRISATVMEASIFRRPYFLMRFLPALLKPRVLPVNADSRMSFIEALRKADKIPPAQYSCYLEACQRLRHQNREAAVCLEGDDDPVQVLRVQLQELHGFVVESSDGEMSAQMSRISHTLSVIFPDSPEERIGQRVISLQLDTPSSADSHDKVSSMILRNFCQCMLDSNKLKPPNKRSAWADQYVGVLLGRIQPASALVHRLWDLLHNQGPCLNVAHMLGLAAFVVHLHDHHRSQSPVMLNAPPLLPMPVSVTEALSSALPCTTQANMLFCLRFCVAAVSYGLCKGNPQTLQDSIPSSLYKKLLYLVPRLLCEARRVLPTGDGPEDSPETGSQPEEPPAMADCADADGGAWRRSALQLWRHADFRCLLHRPQYQLPFTEWLAAELRVQRNEDILSDPERQEYQRWACVDRYLTLPVDQGGCGGNVKALCCHIINTLLDLGQGGERQEPSDKGTCLPDILSRVQELAYEMQLTDQFSSSSRRDDDARHFLFGLVSQRCSLTSDPRGVGTRLRLQQTLHTWNRVLVSLPSMLFVSVTHQGRRTTLDCSSMVEHINTHQRQVCMPAGRLPFHITAHFLRGILSASVRCGDSSEEVNRAWSQMSVQCPLLLVSTVHWWKRLSPVLTSLWGRLCESKCLPEQLTVLDLCYEWTHRSVQEVLFPVPAAPALVLAACLLQAWGCQEASRASRPCLDVLRQGEDTLCGQVLVRVLALCVTDLLSSLLCPQDEDSHRRSRELCSDLLTMLVDSPDWLLIFTSPSSDQGLYQTVGMVAPDELVSLMPFAFYSIVLEQSAELITRATRCPGFLYTAVTCYVGLLDLFLDGRTRCPITAADASQTSEVLRSARRFLLKMISETSPSGLSSCQLRQLETQCAPLDVEVASALTLLQEPNTLSQEMDFL